MTSGVYVLSCRLTSAPLCLGIYLFLWWFLLVIFGLFLLHWRYELPCQDKLPEFHSTPILGCIRILWHVSHPIGLGLDKALCGWNSVNPHPASRTLSMSPPGMGLPHTPRITSKSTLSLAILFSTSPDAVKLLPQTPSSLTLLLLMMVQPWPNSSVAVILLSVMPMASNQPNNSSTPSLITSENGEPWIPSSVMEANMKSPSKSLISSIPYSSKIISLNLITNTKIRLKIALDLPSVTPTLS